MNLGLKQGTNGLLCKRNKKQKKHLLCNKVSFLSLFKIVKNKQKESQCISKLSRFANQFWFNHKSKTRKTSNKQSKQKQPHKKQQIKNMYNQIVFVYFLCLYHLTRILGSWFGTITSSCLFGKKINRQHHCFTRMRRTT